LSRLFDCKSGRYLSTKLGLDLCGRIFDNEISNEDDFENSNTYVTDSRFKAGRFFLEEASLANQVG